MIYFDFYKVNTNIYLYVCTEKGKSGVPILIKISLNAGKGEFAMYDFFGNFANVCFVLTLASLGRSHAG